MMRRICVTVLAVSLMIGVARADDGYAADMGWGSLAVLCNIFYMPAKIVYAVAGGLTGSFAYVLTVGDLDTAQNIWHPTLGGTYVITPQMLRDGDPIEFSPTAGAADAPPLRRRALEEDE